jgi:hypothetical protein
MEGRNVCCLKAWNVGAEEDRKGIGKARMNYVAHLGGKIFSPQMWVSGCRKGVERTWLKIVWFFSVAIVHLQMK